MATNHKEYGKRGELGFKVSSNEENIRAAGWTGQVLSYVVCDSGTYTMLTGCDVLLRNYPGVKI